MATLKQRQQILRLLKEARRLADQYGIPFKDLAELAGVDETKRDARWDPFLAAAPKKD